MTIKDVTNFLEEIAPLNQAEDFDNVGLLLGKTHVDCSKALICHDVIDEIIDEAIHNKCELIISYHPLIFNSLKKINYDQLPFTVLENCLQTWPNQA